MAAGISFKPLLLPTLLIALCILAIQGTLSFRTVPIPAAFSLFFGDVGKVAIEDVFVIEAGYACPWFHKKRRFLSKRT
jgi:hypothetical protein